MFECRRLLVWIESTGITRLVADQHRLPVDKADIIARTRSGSFSDSRHHFENYNELGIRRYDAFLYDGLLSDYRPEYAASPLRNPKTARVFAHYIHVVSATETVV